MTRHFLQIVFILLSKFSYLFYQLVIATSPYCESAAIATHLARSQLADLVTCDNMWILLLFVL